tara:strand:+ start:2254 stop:2607 length:354 start_codon:yes stop_codon:yes gene_type:complete
MSDEKVVRKYTLSVEYAIELLSETSEQISVLKGLFLHFLSDEDEERVDFLPLLSELLWYNYSILKILNKEIDDPILDKDEDNMILLEKNILSLQSFMLSRYYAMLEMNKLSCSTSLN